MTTFMTAAVFFASLGQCPTGYCRVQQPAGYVYTYAQPQQQVYGWVQHGQYLYWQPVQQPPAYSYAQQPAQQASPQSVYASPQAAAGDPAGFLGMLNASRTARGLSAVTWNAAAASAAATNNAYQVARGLGHFFLGGYAQCAAVGQHDAASALAAWAASPPHAAILFDPVMRSIGYSQVGTCHTASGSY